MIDIKKEQERDELHRAIWAIADELRGAVDGWDFKNYVLGTMFYRYISENLTSYINVGEAEAGNLDFDFARMSDTDAEEAREGLVEEKGFFILPSELFCNVRARAASDENLNETLERIFRHIEESAKGTSSEGQFAGLFDDFDVNSNKLGATVTKRNEKLVKLLNGVADMNLGDVRHHDIDAFGDAYEYLMTMYASNAGKSGGEFFTPADVSELLTRLGTVGKTEINKVYDPACGSGSLLLKAEKVLGRDKVRNGFFGQEINITTYNLCRINMFLHDIEFDKFDIACEDTLTAPQHWDDEPFELIVSNPPYSIKWAGDENPLLINDPRFAPAGVLAPKGNADFAFIMHALSWLAPNGTAAIVCFPGILYRAHAEQKIRKYLIDNNYIDCIVQLPDNLFFGTTIATCIMILKKNKPDNKVLFIDASNEFIKITKNNKLTETNISNIVRAYKERENKLYYSSVVEVDKIAQNGYNLSVGMYVEQEDKRETIDIDQLNHRIEQIVAREIEMRAEIERIIAEIESSTFNTLDKGDTKWMTLGEISTIVRGASPRPIKNFVTEDEEGINWIKIGDVAPESKYITATKEKITKEGAKKSRFVKKGDFILSNSMSFGRPYILKIDGCIHDGWLSISGFEKYVTPDYLYHVLTSSFIQKEMAQKAGFGGAVQNLNADIVRSISIPIPSLSEQERIVEMLDGFDVLCNDATNGLVAEVEARRKQYEYYRDKLLTFTR